MIIITTKNALFQAGFLFLKILCWIHTICATLYVFYPFFLFCLSYYLSPLPFLLSISSFILCLINGSRSLVFYLDSSSIKYGKRFALATTPLYVFPLLSIYLSPIVSFFSFFPHTFQQTLSGYSPMSLFVKRYFPSTKEISFEIMRTSLLFLLLLFFYYIIFVFFFESTKVWCPDVALGATRLGGPDPRGLRRITSFNDLPNQEDFPFTDDVLRRVLANNSTSIQQEMDAGNLFIVNHQISLPNGYTHHDNISKVAHILKAY